MKIALREAKEALKSGNFPVGAVLVIDDEIVDTSYNTMNKENDFFSHAEINLLKKHSDKIREAYFKKKNVEIYSTLEPCLMCYSSIILHRINTIYIACSDPHGGFSLNDIKLNKWYGKHKPQIFKNILMKESLDLIIKYLESREEPSLKKMLKLFQTIEPK